MDWVLVVLLFLSHGHSAYRFGQGLTGLVATVPGAVAATAPLPAPRRAVAAAAQPHGSGSEDDDDDDGDENTPPYES